MKTPKFTRKRTKAWHDNHILRSKFVEGQKVLLFNSRLKLFPEKLKSRWSGPFTITKVHPHGAIEIQGNDGLLVIVNGQRLKHYMKGDLVHSIHELTFPN